jgi:hypothetical protein
MTRNPGVGALNDPALGQYLKALLAFLFEDNLEVDMQGLCYPFLQNTAKAPIGENLAHTGEKEWALLQRAQKLKSGRTVMGIGSHHLHQASKPQCVGQQHAFAPMHLLATVKTNGFATFRALHRLAIEDHGGWLRSAAFCFAYCLTHTLIDFLPQPIPAKLTKVVLDRLPFRKIVRQFPPAAARIQYVEDRIQDLPVRDLARCAPFTLLFQQWRNLRIFGII